MSIHQVIQHYFTHLQNADYTQLIALFTPDAQIYSPLYGQQLATHFYQELFKDTQQSNIQLLHTFVNKSQNKGVGYFHYQWILKNGTITEFEGIDVFSFTESLHIKQLKIIYDTYAVRQNFNTLRKINDLSSF